VSTNIIDTKTAVFGVRVNFGGEKHRSNGVRTSKTGVRIENFRSVPPQMVPELKSGRILPSVSFVRD
jgi:hypothetical protein